MFSIPCRRPLGNRGLLDLPPEILVRIFEELLSPSDGHMTPFDPTKLKQSHQHLRGLCLVSNYVCSVATQVLYRVVLLDSPRKTANLLKALLQYPSRQGHVRQIICNIDPGDETVLKQTFEETSNIVSLHLITSFGERPSRIGFSRHYIRSPFYITLCILERVPSLQHLEFWHHSQHAELDWFLAALATDETHTRSSRVWRSLKTLKLRTDGSCESLLRFWACQIIPELQRLEISGALSQRWLFEFAVTANKEDSLAQRLETLDVTGAGVRSFFLLASTFQQSAALKRLCLYEPVVLPLLLKHSEGSADLLDAVFANRAQLAPEWNLNNFLNEHAETLEQVSLSFTAGQPLVDLVFGTTRFLHSINRLKSLNYLRMPICAFYATLTDLQVALGAPRDSEVCIVRHLEALPEDLGSITLESWWPDYLQLGPEDELSFTEYNNAWILLTLNINLYNQHRDVPMDLTMIPRSLDRTRIGDHLKELSRRMKVQLDGQRRRLKENGMDFGREGEHLFELAYQYLGGDEPL